MRRLSSLEGPVTTATDQDVAPSSGIMRPDPNGEGFKDSLPGTPPRRSAGFRRAPVIGTNRKFMATFYVRLHMGQGEGPEEPSDPEPTDPSDAAVPDASAGPPLFVDGLDELEREIADLLNTTALPEEPAASAPSFPDPLPSPPTRPLTPSLLRPPALPPSTPEPPTTRESQLLDEVLRLRGALEGLRAEVAQHRTHLEGVHGQLQKVHTTLEGIRPAAEAAPTGGHAPMSAAPVFLLDEKGQRVADQAFFTLGKGGALERFLTEVIQGWERSGYPIQARGGAEGFSLTLEGDPEGRGLRLLPSGMYLLRLGAEEMARLRKLPPLVSSRHLPRSGGFMKAD